MSLLNVADKDVKSSPLMGRKREDEIKVILRKESMHASTSSLNWSGKQIIREDGRQRKISVMEAADAAAALRNKSAQNLYFPAPVGKVTLPLIIAAAVTVLGNSLPHGYNTGVLNTPASLIQHFLADSYEARTGSAPDESILNILWATSVSVYLIGGCAGAFSAGFMADRFGRKRALLVCHIFGIISSFMFAFCKMANSFEMLIIARVVTGFGCGAGSGLVPMYLTEISPVNIRGAMGVLHQFGLTFGILLSQIFGLTQLLGNENLWQCLLAMLIIPCIISYIVLPWFPDSPRYLMVNKNDEKGAEKALQVFRGKKDVKQDMEEMRFEKSLHETEERWTFLQLFRAKVFRLPLLLICSLAMSQQLSGINVVFYYSSGVFLDAGISESNIQYVNIGIGLVNVIMTGISVPLMEKSGRRRLLCGGMMTMIVASVVLTVALNLQHMLHWMSYVSILCIITFVIGFAIGLGSIPQFIGAELFPQGPRPPAMSFAGFLNWLCNFIVGISFPSMQSALKAYTFIIFIVVDIGFCVLLYFKLPETKNKTYDEIYKIFNMNGVTHNNSADPSKTTAIHRLSLRNSVSINVDNASVASSATDIHRQVKPIAEENTNFLALPSGY